jgi:hypothetical protein
MLPVSHSQRVTHREHSRITRQFICDITPGGRKHIILTKKKWHNKIMAVLCEMVKQFCRAVPVFIKSVNKKID